MSSRDRIGTVLRVRRVQELQAAGAFGMAAAASREAERSLADLASRYEAAREVDLRDGLVPERLRDAEVRTLQAEAVQRGRERVRAALTEVEARRADLCVRNQAVRALERLDERLAEDELVERRREEIRELDERATTAAARRTER